MIKFKYTDPQVRLDNNLPDEFITCKVDEYGCWDVTTPDGQEYHFCTWSEVEGFFKCHVKYGGW